MHAARTLSLALSSTLVVCLVACGGSDGASEYPSQEQDVSKAEPAPGSLGTGGATTTPAGSGDLAACATSTAAAEPKPVYLVFAYDKSGSMKDNSKWDACKAATKAFFESPSSAGVHASLMFFPSASNICTSANYETPAVAMTALPATTLGAALDTRAPDGYTPTHAALKGAISYAKNLQATSAKDGTVAVVMVTDGIPQNCEDNLDVGPAAAEAAGAASVVPTYVVGVGSSLTNLDQIAAAGGTTHAFIVTVGNPAQTQADLTAAIETIKKSALSCNYTIPAPPSGQTFDRSKVNVVYTPAGGAASTLDYNPTCAGGTGWKYDDAGQPKEVVLCEAACNVAKGGAGKVDIVFGCATNGPDIK